MRAFWWILGGLALLLLLFLGLPFAIIATRRRLREMEAPPANPVSGSPAVGGPAAVIGDQQQQAVSPQTPLVNAPSVQTRQSALSEVQTPPAGLTYNGGSKLVWSR